MIKVKRALICTKHPKYKGLKPPADCSACKLVYITAEVTKS